MRVFLAIELPETLRNRIGVWAQELRLRLPNPKKSIRWVNPDQFHLTLKFIGECRETDLARLHSAFQETVRSHASFDLTLEGLGSFKKGSLLKVLWVGVSEGKDNVKNLARDLNKACAAVGFAGESAPFHPHLTLARSKESFLARTIDSVLGQVPVPVLGPIRVEKISLIQSVLSPQGPHYTRLLSVGFSRLNRQC